MTQRNVDRSEKQRDSVTSSGRSGREGDSERQYGRAERLNNVTKQRNCELSIFFFFSFQWPPKFGHAVLQ